MEIVDGKPYLDQAKNLIVEYTERLGRDLAFQNIDDELKDLSRKYAGQEGALLVAIDGKGNVGGMVAYHRHSDDRCEMKRLYVKPEFRGEKLGERLIREILKRARQAGYKEMVLDTITPLQSAIHLYKKFGFAECAPYYDNPMDDVIYMKKSLCAQQPAE